MNAEPKSIFTPEQDLPRCQASFDASKTSICRQPSSNNDPSLSRFPAKALHPRDSIVAHSNSPSVAHAVKRARSESQLAEIGKALTISEPSRKKRRPKLQRRNVETSNRNSSAEVSSPLLPVFSSRTSKQRPTITHSRSGTELAAAMLSTGRDEHGQMTTLKMARGCISPSRSSSLPIGSLGSELSGTPSSPGPRGQSVAFFNGIGIIELLEQDERPTFCIDIANPINFIPGGPLQVLFSNASLRAHAQILDMVTGHSDLASPVIAVTYDFPAFKTWALSYVNTKIQESMDVSLPSFSYGGITWACSTLRKRIRVIRGNLAIIGASPSGGLADDTSVPSEHTTSPPNACSSPAPVDSIAALDYFGATRDSAPLSETADHEAVGALHPPRQAMRAFQSEAVTSEMMHDRYVEEASFDWTRLPLSPALPKHIQFVRSIDWASTPLGPIENWAFDLRAMCNLIMGSPHPAAMYWGNEYIAIYNEAYILMAGQKHPTLMGQSYKTAWAEIWPEIEDVFINATLSGQATMKDDDCLFMARNGFLEETYFSWSIVPLIGEDGSVVGLYNPCFEKTRRKIAERRMLTLREVGEKTQAARDVKAFWGLVIKGLEYNPYDVPFAFLYSVVDELDSDLSSIHSGSLSQAPQCKLEGTIGVPIGHSSTSSPLDLKTSDDSFAPYFRESMKSDRPLILTTADGTLSASLIEGLQCRGFGDPCRAAIVCPLHATTGESILGFLVMGVNPRRPYDDDYSLFIQLINRQLATSMASVVLFEEEIRRGQRAARLAAADRQELSKQLDIRTREAVESETKFKFMAEFAPVGLFIANSVGEITYSNDTWWEISRHPRSANSVSKWMESIKDIDRRGVDARWKELVDQKRPITHEFRFKTPWQGSNGVSGDTWVLMSAYPEKDEHERLKSVFGSITNISQQKWAEDWQKRRMEEAIELKRQQENFIDMTSHEMRNPLSAILQCADEISTSLADFKSSTQDSFSLSKLDETLDSSIDAAQTIALCAQHQKRIVDDILTLSKLDSALLIVTPVAVQPVAVVQRALKMFESELETNDIAMEFRMEKSYLDLTVDWVKLDPSRLLQVLINLITNAIKFTQSESRRTLVVSIGASRQRPDGSSTDVKYFPSRSKRADLCSDTSEWGSGETLYLHFAVQDTGRGLSHDEKNILFQRFTQASPRTHVQYGGSGLGLFISRELTELQGGEIGVASEKGVGSIFAFYIQSRRMNMPADTPIATSINTLRSASYDAKSITVESRRNSSGKASLPFSAKMTSPKQAPPSPYLLDEPVSELPPAAEPTLDFSTLTILIVEDNLVNQKVLQKQLRNLGFPTLVANHGGEAIDILKASRFWKGQEETGDDLAIILMDLEMPVMDGLTCARRIRDLEREGTIVRHVPIVAVTANARLQQIETAMASGMDDVVSKPFRVVTELIPKIEELIRASMAGTQSAGEEEAKDREVQVS